MNVIDPQTDQVINLDIKLTQNDSPIEVANQILNRFNINLLTYRWLLRSFQHAFARLKEEEVVRVDVNIGDTALEPIVVRYGDDLSMLSRLYAFQQGFDLDAAGEVYKTLVENIPQHSSVDWVNRRKAQTTVIASANANAAAKGLDSASIARDRYTTSNQCELSVVIATSGDFNLFRNLVQTFPTSNLLCEVIVVDGGASASTNRAAMLEQYPHFNFIFKSRAEMEGSGSRASALNMVTRITKSRYLFYISDLWANIASSDEHLHQALAVLKSDVTGSIAQVILNDQSSSSCQSGAMDMATEGSEGSEGGVTGASICNGKGGWTRVLNFENGASFPYIENE